MTWLAAGRTVESTFSLGAAREHSRCRERTLRFPDGNVEQAAELDTGGTVQVFPLSYPFRDARGRRVGRPSGIALTKLQLAGCPAALEALIGSVLGHRDRAPRLGAARFGGRDALTLRIWTPAGTMTIFLDAADKRPLGLALTGGRLAGAARLRWTAGTE